MMMQLGLYTTKDIFTGIATFNENGDFQLDISPKVDTISKEIICGANNNKTYSKTAQGTFSAASGQMLLNVKTTTDSYPGSGGGTKTLNKVVNSTYAFIGVGLRITISLEQNEKWLIVLEK
jgi:hypothetical protein